MYTYINIFIGDNGKDKGNYYGILGLYRDNGTEMGTTIMGPFPSNEDPTHETMNPKCKFMKHVP